MADLPEIESFKDVQHLHHHHATRARRRHADDFVTAVAAANRFAFERLVIVQVLERDDAAILLHEVDDQARGLAAVKLVLAVFLDTFKRVSEVRLLPGVAELIKRTVFSQENLRRTRVLVPPWLEFLE